MRPSDPHQPPSARPNLVSVNRKRAGSAAGILDQIEPGAGGAGWGLELNARWLVASCVVIVGLVVCVAGIAYMNATTRRILPKADGPRPKIATASQPAQAAPARIERLADAGPPAAPMGFEQAPGSATAPPPIAAAAQPQPAAPDASAETARVLAGTDSAVDDAVRVPAAIVAAARPVVQRSARRHPVVRSRARAQPAVPATAHEQDPDVELISAIRKATEKVAD